MGTTEPREIAVDVEIAFDENGMAMWFRRGADSMHTMWSGKAAPAAIYRLRTTLREGDGMDGDK